MHSIDQIYIDGEFVTPHGEERFDLYNPATAKAIGSVRLGDVEDTRRAIAAAKRAFATYSRSAVAERIELLHRLHKAVVAREADMTAAMTLEYGAPPERARWTSVYAAQTFLDAAKTLETYPLSRRVGSAEVVMEPVGVAALITPWNANAGFICNKLATALAAGCTVVIKPSEMSAIQTQVVLEALHDAGLPKGLFNVVNGRGDVVGNELSTNRDIAKISFTGSTLVGKTIMRNATETLEARDAGTWRQVADRDPAGCRSRNSDSACGCRRFHQFRPGLHRRHPHSRASRTNSKKPAASPSRWSRTPGLATPMTPPPRSARWSARSNGSACSATSSSA
jgi:aldehyde dehydrogenase (NAD+)